MTTKFNPKQYQDKARIYRPVPGAVRVLRLWVWDAVALEYKAPQKGKCYEARRYEVDPSSGKKARVKQSFDTLEEARNWQSGLGKPGPTTPTAIEVNRGPSFADVVLQWKKRKFPTLQETTRVAYEKILRLYLGEFMSLGLYEITPERVDIWLEGLKDPNGWAMQSTRRYTFRHEVEVLSAVLRYYEDYHTDRNFYFPIKRRHWEDAKTSRPKVQKAKDLSVEEFYRFRAELEKSKYGALLAPLATIQYFQALRVSEALAIFHEDVRLVPHKREESRLVICRSVVNTRQRGRESYIKDGFKNSARFPGGLKELPVFPQTYEVLAALSTPGAKGLLFSLNGKPIEYRTVQHYYDQAFRRAGLPYTATHVLRHGWTREVFNQTPDMEVAKQLLGDVSDEAAKVYAVRRAGALTRVAQEMWKEQNETGRNWSQNKTDNLEVQGFQEEEIRMAGGLGFEPR